MVYILPHSLKGKFYETQNLLWKINDQWSFTMKVYHTTQKNASPFVGIFFQAPEMAGKTGRYRGGSGRKNCRPVSPERQ
jgi:hypothetical protein